MGMLDNMQGMAEVILSGTELIEVEEHLAFMIMCEDMTESEVRAWNKEREPFVMSWSLKQLGQMFGVGDKAMGVIGKLSKRMLAADKKAK